MMKSGISQTELGRALDLSPPAITKLKKMGMPIHSVEAARAWRIDRLSVARRKPEAAPKALPQIQLVGDGAHQPVPDYNASRARREAAEAQMAELRLAEERGDLVRAASAKAAAQKRYAGLREALLQLPARVVPVLVANPDAAAMDQILRAEIVAALAQLTSRVE